MSSSFQISAPVSSITSAQQEKTERARNGAGASYASRAALHDGITAPARTSHLRGQWLHVLARLVCRGDGLSARDHIGRRTVEPVHQRLHVGAADEAELEVHLCGLRYELRVAHGGGEGRA